MYICPVLAMGRQHQWRIIGHHACNGLNGPNSLVDFRQPGSHGHTQMQAYRGRTPKPVTKLVDCFPYAGYNYRVHDELTAHPQCHPVISQVQAVQAGSLQGIEQGLPEQRQILLHTSDRCHPDRSWAQIFQPSRVYLPLTHKDRETLITR